MVERLHHRLVVAKLVLAADLRAQVPLCLAEIEMAVGALDDSEADRAAALRRVAEDWRLAPEELTLSRLALEAPDPWGAMFAEHVAAFTTLTEEIAAVQSEGHRIASTSLHSLRTSIGTLTSPVAEGYTSRGLAAAAPVAPVRIDRPL